MKESFYIIVFLLCGYPAFAQSKSAADFSGFIKFVEATHRIPQSIQTNCNWQYGIIKVSSNKTPKVTGYVFLNVGASDTLKKSFSFLTKYSFVKKPAVSQHPVMVQVINSKIRSLKAFP